MLKIILFFSSLLIWLNWWIITIFSTIITILLRIILPERYHDNLVKLLCRTLLYSVLLFPEVKGYNIKKIPFPSIFTPNHVTFFDLFISGSVLPGNPRGIELKSHFNYPFYGWLISIFGMIPIQPGNFKSVKCAIKNALKILKNKERNLLVMPEGTRSKNGGLNIFKSGAFHLSRKSGVPVVPVAFKGLFKLKNRNNIIIRPGKFEVILLKPVYPANFKTDDDMALYVRKQIIKELVKDPINKNQKKQA